MKRFCYVLSAAILAACSYHGGASLPGAPLLPNASPAVKASHVRIGLPKGYSISVFAKGTKKLTNPDPIVVVGKWTYVAFQNATGPTGTGGDSTIVQYDARGEKSKSISVPGRCDGLRWDPYTKLLWITLNEDANSQLYTWKPSSNTIGKYTWSSAKHGGGYDDLAFANGMAFVAASNPTLNSAGINTGPALV